MKDSLHVSVKLILKFKITFTFLFLNTQQIEKPDFEEKIIRNQYPQIQGFHYVSSIDGRVRNSETQGLEGESREYDVLYNAVSICQ